MSLSGLKIVVAGGTGGLGSAVAHTLAEDGAKILVSYHHNEARAKELSKTAEVVQVDVTQPEGRSRLLDAAADFYGLVVFTGTAARGPNDWEESLQVNYLGPIQLARDAVARLKHKGTSGSIILIATMQTVGVFPGSTVYAGAKAALVHAGRILAKESRGPAEVRVNIISPGVIAAGMARASIQSGKYDKYLRDGHIPRWGTPDDVGRAIRLFLEPDNYITGQHLVIDGGLNL